jgi:hypothetical protein
VVAAAARKRAEEAAAASAAAAAKAAAAERQRLAALEAEAAKAREAAAASAAVAAAAALAEENKRKASAASAAAAAAAAATAASSAASAAKASSSAASSAASGGGGGGSSGGGGDEPLPPGWEQATTESGSTYYYHAQSRISRWTVPTSDVAERIAERVAADEEEKSRKLQSRVAEMKSAEEEAAAARAEAEVVRSGISKAAAQWAERCGWRGRKVLRREVRAGGEGADSLPKRILASLLSSLGEVPIEGWGGGGGGGGSEGGGILGSLASSPSPLALPKGWRWSDPSPASLAAITDSALKKAYLLTVRCLHPDKTQGLPLVLRLGGEEVFQLLNAAYQAMQDHKDGSLTANATVTEEAPTDEI